MNDVYPWQRALWKRLLGMRARMPHALLIHGSQGIGKQHFALSLAAALLCESPDADGHACGACLGCGWLEQGNHPDFRLIEPEDQAEEDAAESSQETAAPAKGKKKSRLILIDQIRAIAELVSLTTHRHGLRVVVLQPAEAMNPAAANALLKMLEEPPPSTLFILVTHRLARVLPTIRSRCHKIAMALPTRSEAESWLAGQGIADPAFSLAQSGGAPLAALELDNADLRAELVSFARQLQGAECIDASAAAAHWSKEGYLDALSALQKWTYDLTAARLTGSGVRYFPDHFAALKEIATRADLSALLDFQRILLGARAQAHHPLNSELQLEALLVRYAQIFPSPARP